MAVLGSRGKCVRPHRARYSRSHTASDVAACGHSSAWPMRASLAHAWPMRASVAHAWPMLGPCLAHAWPMRGPCVAHARPMRGPCLAHAWPMLGPCLAHAWPMLNPCVAHACKCGELDGRLACARVCIMCSTIVQRARVQSAGASSAHACPLLPHTLTMICV